MVKSLTLILKLQVILLLKLYGKNKNKFIKDTKEVSFYLKNNIEKSLNTLKEIDHNMILVDKIIKLASKIDN